MQRSEPRRLGQKTKKGEWTMPSDYDHIQALTNMMENLKRETEAKCRDIEEVILSLKKAPKLISGFARS
jgi:hypothetical protein